jgi:hypothetical protein
VSIIIFFVDVSCINLSKVNDGGLVVVLQLNVIVKPKTDMKIMNLKLMAGNGSGLALRGKSKPVCPAHELKIERITDAQNMFVRHR